MDKEVETVFFKMRSLNKAVKEYFVSRGLTSVAAINEFPATDLQLLKEQFNDCPEIKKLAVRHEILCFFNELKNLGKTFNFKLQRLRLSNRIMLFFY